MAEKYVGKIGNEKYRIVIPREEMNFFQKVGSDLKKFWHFLKKDSFWSLIVNLLLALIIIKFIFFPLLSFITGSALPLVIVESCSMYHSNGIEEVLDNKIYSQYNIGLADAEKWSLRDGLNKGDIIFVVGSSKLSVGDIIIFNANMQNPLIHRIISIKDGKITTKGDHNSGLLEQEKEISESQIVGKAVFKIPLVGWVKLIFFDFQKSAQERGLCS